LVGERGVGFLEKGVTIFTCLTLTETLLTAVYFSDVVKHVQSHLMTVTRTQYKFTVRTTEFPLLHSHSKRLLASIFTLRRNFSIIWFRVTFRWFELMTILWISNGCSRYSYGTRPSILAAFSRYHIAAAWGHFKDFWRVFRSSTIPAWSWNILSCERTAQHEKGEGRH
jgi:hypothetical protein